MSLRTVVTVHCDGPGCWELEYTSDYDAADRRRRGWVTTDGAMSRRRDLCPKCAAAPAEPTAPEHETESDEREQEHG